MNSKNVRTEPPSASANNQDVFIWALFILGGADHEVDVEDIYIKAFELAPARIGWRTRPEIPDYKKTSKALQSVEAKTHVGLVHKTHPLARRLTAQGVAWVTQFRPLLETVYESKPVEASSTNRFEKLRRSVYVSPVWNKFQAEATFSIYELAELFECSTGSPSQIWNSRIEDLRRASQVLDDEKLNELANSISTFIDEGISI